jgi:signal transduction histidine kinase/CheY-like chemotaxis protein/CHASE3 domain sensor protein/HPt (histidine-containing phosphotransfer) domain-containing protein
MARLKVSLPAKIAFLLFAGVIIIVFTGYLSYRSISSVVTMIYKYNAPDEGLATIREITTTIDLAENNVRLYGLTREGRYLRKYRELTGGIDTLIENLYNQYPEDEWFALKIDTIDKLINTKTGVWREMIAIWRVDTSRSAISNLALKLQLAESEEGTEQEPIQYQGNGPVKEPLQIPVHEQGQAADSASSEGFFKRIFGRRNRPERTAMPDSSKGSGEATAHTSPLETRAEGSEDSTMEHSTRVPPTRNEQLLELIGEIEKNEKETGLRLQAKETELTRSSSSLTEAFLSLMAQLEAYEREIDLARYEKAGALSEKTFLLIAIFSITGTLLSILVFFLVIQYSRKNRAYNEALVRSRQETEELARAKELFLANVSHEIRTPLNAISGFIKQLLGMELDTRFKEKIEIVDSASDQLIRLTNDTLDLAKLQAGKLSLNNVHFNPAEEVRIVCALFTEMAEKNGNQLSYNVANPEQLTLFGDAYRFRQILNNLLSNALKFTENGLIEVAAQVTLDQDGSSVLILSVQDTGQGIDEANLEKIFHDFTQEHEDTGIRHGGTGLGLSIVKKLVALFSGNVRVESKKGTGTLVTCTLRFAIGDPAMIKADRPEEMIPELPEGLHFLVADDEEFNCKLISTILDKHNAEYEVAMNGVDAVQLLSERHYDVVLMDLRMPGVDGIHAARFIRETLHQSKDQLPVLGITADVTDQVRTDSGGLFNAFLVKPFTESQLLRAVTEAMRFHAPAPVKKTGGTPSVPAGQEGDLTELIRMSGDDMGFVEEMIVQFEKSTCEGLLEMESALEEDRYGTIRDLAHKLAPPSRYLGLSHLLELFREIEKRAPRGNKMLLRDLIGKAKLLCSEAGKHLHDQFQQMQKTE